MGKYLHALFKAMFCWHRDVQALLASLCWYSYIYIYVHWDRWLHEYSRDIRAGTGVQPRVSLGSCSHTYVTLGHGACVYEATKDIFWTTSMVMHTIFVHPRARKTLPHRAHKCSSVWSRPKRSTMHDMDATKFSGWTGLTLDYVAPFSNIFTPYNKLKKPLLNVYSIYY